MAAAHESTLVCDGDSDAINRHITEGVVILTREHSEFRIEQEEPGRVVLKVRVNWLSWGERVTVQAEPRSIRIVSECSFPLQVIDWGKNRENVEIVRSAILRAAQR